jgi:hypothetical protein
MMLEQSYLSPNQGSPSQQVKSKCSQVSIFQQQTNSH